MSRENSIDFMKEQAWIASNFGLAVASEEVRGRVVLSALLKRNGQVGMQVGLVRPFFLEIT